jgi:hypothetical protein
MQTMATKRKLEDVISEILVADTDSESGTETSGGGDDDNKEDRQAGPSHRLPDITLPDMMTVIALALQIGHERQTA